MGYEAAQNCPLAKASLATKVKQDWCRLAESKVRCNWEYQAWNQTKIHGDFSYAPDRSDCTQACDLLGSNSNEKEIYCNPDFVDQLAAFCPEAKASLQTNNMPWCKKATATLGVRLGASSVLLARAPNRSAALARPSSLEGEDQCNTAFKKPYQCFNEVPFKDCCDKDCGSAGAWMTCSWAMDLPGGDHINASFLSPPLNENYNKACAKFSQVQTKFEICPGSDLFAEIQKCTRASQMSLKEQLCKPGSSTNKRICPATGRGALTCDASVETEM